MREWNDQAVILRIKPFREADLRLTLLSDHKGRLLVFAFGGRRSRRRFCGCLDLLNTVQCHIKTSGRQEFLNLTEASLVTAPHLLRQNWQRMGLAANCILFLEALGVNSEQAGETFFLVENLRKTLEQKTSISTLFPLFFRLRLLVAAGYAPDLQTCRVCGTDLKQKSAFFHVQDGRAVCENCAKGQKGTGKGCFHLSATCLELLRYVECTSPYDWPVATLSFADRLACAGTIDSFIRQHLGIVWKNGRFIRT